MDVSSIYSSTLSSFAKSLRRVVTENFKTGEYVTTGPGGTYSTANNTLNFIPDRKHSPKETNFVAIKRPLKDQYTAAIKISLTDTSTTENRRAGFVFGYKDEENFLMATFNYKNHEAQIIRYDNGQKTILETKTLKASSSKEFTMELDVNQKEYALKIGTEESIRVKDSTTPSGTGFGFGSFDGTASFQNLEVYGV